jgi:KaiC/GvpD/RAD55 family RecA-like ATPase
MTKSSSLDNRCKTGIPGLDDILSGGIPLGTCVLVAGGPGSGKTILSIQFLFEGAKNHGELGLLVTFEESPKSIRKNMLKFGWDLAKLEEDGKLRILDLSDFIYHTPEEFHKKSYGIDVAEFTVVGALGIIKNHVDELKASRVVVDSLTSLSIFEADEAKRRMNLAHLFKGMRDLNCTTLVTLEASVAKLDREFQLEEYLADGVLLLQFVYSRERVIKSILVQKMRGISHDTQPRPYIIDEKGISIFPLEKIL